MNQFIQNRKTIITAFTACLFIGSVTMSFQNTPFGPLDKLDTLNEQQDTIPEKTRDSEVKMSIRDFDQLMLNMDKEMLQMQQEITKIDFDKIHKEITASLNKVDFDKIKMNLDKAMKEIDFGKIEQGVKTALKEVELNKLSEEAKVSLQDAKKEIEKINLEQVKKEIEKAKLEIEKSKKEIKKIDVDEIMNKANVGLAKAKEELHLTKEMFNEMEKDGLISQKEGFTIEYKDKTIIINGKKKGETISNKYRPYIKGDYFRIKISKE
ncbi:MAG: hypothetical protein H7Z13_14745 [Ferruginibacter sp.]|nr:hypothetical protein [Ferruginibacter sp.]